MIIMCLKVLFGVIEMMKIVICQMTVLRVGVGFEGSSLYLCFSTLKSVKNGQFSTLKTDFGFKGLRVLLEML